MPVKDRFSIGLSTSLRPSGMTMVDANRSRERGRWVVSQGCGKHQARSLIAELMRFDPYHGIDVVSEKTNTGFAPLMKLVSYWNHVTLWWSQTESNRRPLQCHCHGPTFLMIAIRSLAFPNPL